MGWPLWTPNCVMNGHYSMGWPLRTPCIAAAITVLVDHYGHPIVWWAAITVWVDHYGHPALRPPLRYGLTITDILHCSRHYGMGWPIWTPNRVMGRHYGMGWPLRTPCVHHQRQRKAKEQSCDGRPLRHGWPLRTPYVHRGQQEDSDRNRVHPLSFHLKSLIVNGKTTFFFFVHYCCLDI